jgi:hypothetical protein
MASIILLKDHGSAKKGETISVPFSIGRELFVKGVGIYPPSASQPKAKTDAASELEIARKKITEMSATIEAKDAAIGELHKQIGALTAPKKLDDKKPDEKKPHNLSDKK